MRREDVPELPEDLHKPGNWHGPMEWAADLLLVAASVDTALRWLLLYPVALHAIGAPASARWPACIQPCRGPRLCVPA